MVGGIISREVKSHSFIAGRLSKKVSAQGRQYTGSAKRLDCTSCQLIRLRYGSIKINGASAITTRSSLKINLVKTFYITVLVGHIVVGNHSVECLNHLLTGGNQ